MPNYYGNVHCSYCGRAGYNKRGCELLTEAFQQRYNRAVDENVTSDMEYYGAALGKRTGTNPHTGETKIKRRREYGRRCSYCQERGHNRRKCPTIASDKAVLSKATATMRKGLLRLLRASGCVPGAMVTARANSWDENSVFPALILDFHWSEITAQNLIHNPASIRVLKACRMDTGMKVDLQIPATGRGESEDHRALRLASPAHNCELEPPAGWLDGEGIDYDSTGLFSKGDRRDYWFWDQLDKSLEKSPFSECQEEDNDS